MQRSDTPDTLPSRAPFIPSRCPLPSTRTESREDGASRQDILGVLWYEAQATPSILAVATARLHEAYVEKAAATVDSIARPPLNRNVIWCGHRGVPDPASAMSGLAAASQDDQSPRTLELKLLELAGVVWGLGDLRELPGDTHSTHYQHLASGARSD